MLFQQSAQAYLKKPVMTGRCLQYIRRGGNWTLRFDRNAHQQTDADLLYMLPTDRLFWRLIWIFSQDKLVKVLSINAPEIRNITERIGMNANNDKSQCPLFLHLQKETQR